MRKIWCRILAICLVFELFSGQAMMATKENVLSTEALEGKEVQEVTEEKLEEKTEEKTEEKRFEAKEEGLAEVEANQTEELPALPTQLNTQSGEVVVVSARSTYLDGSSADKKDWKNQSLIVKYAANPKYRRDGVIGFDLPSFEITELQQAKLKFYVTKADTKKQVTPAVEVYGFSGDWKEEELSWNHQPDFSGEELLGSAEPKVNTWVEYDITDYVKRKYSENALSFHILGDKQSEVYLNIASAKSGFRPQVVLTIDSSSGPISGDTQKDVEDENAIERKVFMEGNDTILKSLYVDANAPDKNRSKTASLLIGQEYSAYLYATETVKYPKAENAFLRFYVEEDYKTEPIPVEIWGLTDTSEVGENTSHKNPATTESEKIYELAVTNRGWYSVDVSEYVKNRDSYGFYIKAKNKQTAPIKVASYNSTFTPVLYTAPKEDEFDKVRKSFAIQKGNYDVSNPAIQAMIANIDKRAEDFLAKIDTTDNRTKVFQDYPLDIATMKQELLVKNPSWNEERAHNAAAKAAADNMRNSYVRLSNLLRAYRTKGSKFEDDAAFYQAIKDGLESLYQLHYNPYTRESGNWWQWEIGTPKVLGEMIVSMYDDLSPEVRMNYLYAIYRFQPDPEQSYYNRNSLDPKEALPPQKSVGANRVDTCIGDLLLGIAAKNPELMQKSVDALHDVYQYVDKEDGFYRDGSFIQHKNIAYTTGYGMVLISGLTDLDYKLDGSRWEITDRDYENVYAWLENAFIPMVFDGQAFPLVAGRSLSRQQGKTEVGSSFSDGYRVARMLYTAAKGAPQEKKDRFLSLARRYMEKNTFYNVRENASNIAMLEEWDALQKVEMAEAYFGSHVFANMDRVIHHRGDYAMGLAMFSSRIQNFEMMNNENLKGWNQGNGALYLLNGDSGQYDNAFWPTVDSYRLAGTTVVDIARTNVDHKEEFVMQTDFVGGVSLDNRYSVAAMDLGLPDKSKNKNLTYHATLKAKKSWFFFDDEIIALGSGIESKDDAEVETIVENRMIREDAGNLVLINGNQVLENTGAVKEDFDAVSWAYLEGNQDKTKAAIGYYFPEPVRLSGIKERATGTWKSINGKGSDDFIHRNYLKFWLSHGKNPVDGQYSYAILPSKTADEVRMYAEKPHYEVVKNTSQVQAVKEHRLGILAANVFDASQGDLGRIRVDQPSSLMLQEKDGRISFSIADPTMKLQTPIRVSFVNDREIRVIRNSDNVKVLSTKPLQLEIDLANSKGAAATLQGQYVSEEPLLPYVPAAPRATEEPAVVIESESVAQSEVLATDIQDSWAKSEISELLKLRIVRGYPDRSFLPNGQVTRAEAAQLFSNLMQYLKIGDQVAKPEGSGNWYDAAIAHVKQAKLMFGDGKEFYPNRRMTRQEAFTVLGRLGEWSLQGEDASSILSVFTDNAEVAAYAKPYIAEMVRMGMIRGENDRLYPNQYISRAELAVMIYRELQVLKKK